MNTECHRLAPGNTRESPLSKLELVRNPSQTASAASESVLEEVLSGRMNGWTAERILEWGFDRFAPRIALSASFGSPEGMVLFDLMNRIDPDLFSACFSAFLSAAVSAGAPALFCFARAARVPFPDSPLFGSGTSTRPKVPSWTEVV